MIILKHSYIILKIILFFSYCTYYELRYNLLSYLYYIDIIAVKRSEAAHNSMTPTLFCLKKKRPNFDMYHVVIMHNVLLLKVSMV